MPSKRKVVLKKTRQEPDWFLLITVLVLTVFGLLMLANASVAEAYQDFGDKLFYFKLQCQWALLGLLFFGIASFFDHLRVRFLAVPLLVFTLFSLVAVLLPGVGIEVLGARRWLGIGQFRFQPAELAKFAFVFYLSAFLSQKRRLWPFLLLMILLVVLIMLEPDLGTMVIVVASGLVVYFVSGAPLLVMFLIGVAGLLTGTGLIYFSDYRRQRLLTFFNPARDPLGASYHIRQVLIALGSGGLFGVGLGQSRQKYEYLPMVTTDSIFAVIAEETGFFGASLLLLAFLIFIWRGIKIAKEVEEPFSQLLAAGITAWIGLQALINLAAMVVLIPLTGVPLPFISYGGSSLVLALTGAGILVNISKFRVVKK